MQLNLFGNTKPQKTESPEMIFWQGHNIQIRRKAYSRKWSLQIEPSGTAKLTCPKGASLHSLNKWLKEMEPWLKKQFSKVQEYQKKFPPKQFVNGESFEFLGKSYLLEKQWAEITRAQFTPDQRLLVQLNLQSRMRDVKKLVHDCYLREARGRIPSQIERWSNKMGLYPRDLSLRNQKTRWGSCSARGHISINWRLIAAPQQIIDYVIIHELAHLKHPNHSLQFWTLVEQFAPEWRKDRDWLRENQLAFEFLRPSKL